VNLNSLIHHLAELMTDLTRIVAAVVVSVTQEKSIDLGGVDERCGGTYGPCQKYKALFNSA
jgi:hypothetical protein